MWQLGTTRRIQYENRQHERHPSRSVNLNLKGFLEVFANEGREGKRRHLGRGKGHSLLHNTVKSNEGKNSVKRGKGAGTGIRGGARSVKKHLTYGLEKQILGHVSPAEAQ